MAYKKYTGAAEIRIDAGTLTVGGTIQVGDIFNVVLGGATVKVVAATTVIATVATQIYNALVNDDTAPAQFLAVTFTNPSSGVIGWTGPDDGRDISTSLSITTTETGGGAADSQTFVRAVTKVGTGRRDYTNVDNWADGSLPTTGDEVHLGLGVDLPRYNIGGQSGVLLAALYLHRTDIENLICGLDEFNTDENDDFYEYLTTHLTIGATAVYIGVGEGRFVPRLYLNTSADTHTIYAYKTGVRDDRGNAPVHIKGSSTSNVLAVCNDELDLGTQAGSVWAGATVQANEGANVIAGVGTTGVATVNVANKGVVTWHGVRPTTAINVYGGGIFNMMPGASGTTTAALVEENGVYNAGRASHVVTTMTSRGGKIDADAVGDRLGSKTFTNLELYNGKKKKPEINDPNKTLVLTNGIDFHGYNPFTDDISVGNDLKVTLGATT